MRRIVIGAGIAGIGALLARALAPKLHQRALAGCERMFEQMPDNFPPKRMMRGIDEIRSNTERTLELLDERGATGGSAPAGDVSETAEAAHAA